MDETQIYRIAYVSTSCDCFKLDDICNIVERSKINNTKENITGILLYCNKYFLQILEGERKSVEKLFDKISIDCKHDSIIKIQEGNIKQRNFPNWSLAFKSYNQELKNLDDFNNKEFYCYVNKQLNLENETNISLRLLADFFDLNG